MEVLEMDEVKQEENCLISAAAFVEGGIQEACDDACSICLEAFSDSDPSTVTNCRHEFHFQCILEWCQRSSNCPMCWQPISLKDSASQELLEAVERERAFRLTPARSATIFHHPTLGDFELQHIPMGINAPELEDRIIQHLAAAAAMGRTHRVARRESSRSRSSAHNARSQIVLFSTNPNASSTGPSSASIAPDGAESNSPIPLAPNDEVLRYMPSSAHSDRISASSTRSFAVPTTRQGVSAHNDRYARESSLLNQDNAGPSEFQSLSDSWKSRLNSMSSKYKESISKSTKGWKEKLFSRGPVADIGSEVRREVNAGIASVSRLMEHLETRETNRAQNVGEASNGHSTITHASERDNGAPSNGSSASYSADSVSSQVS